MVFRKLADVQREKELAERRKDDPPLDVSTDLAVRKLLSRLQRRNNENHRTLSTSSQAELQADDGDEQTGNGISSSGGGGGNAAASKPSAKLQFAKLLRGTVASVATTSATSNTGGTTTSTTTNTSASRDGSPSPSNRPPSRTTTKPPGTYTKLLLRSLQRYCVANQALQVTHRCRPGCEICC